MRKLEYPCQLIPDEERGFSVSFPDVPEALTYGGDRHEALEMAEDALSVALTFYLENGEPVPVPGSRRAGQVSVSPNLQIALKIALADALRESRKRPADLARLIGTDFKSVKRLLDPNHSSRIPALEKALACLGKRVAITTEDKVA